MNHLHSLKDINTVFSDTQARLLREGMQCIFFQWGVMKIMLKSTNTSRTYQSIPAIQYQCHLHYSTHAYVIRQREGVVCFVL